VNEEQVDSGAYNGRWKQLILGVILATGAPLGWLGVQMLRGYSLSGELIGRPYLYGYLLFATGIAFGAFGYNRGRREERLEKLAHKYAEASITDNLTGLFQAHYFRTRLAEQMSQHRREDGSLALLVADLDHFKKVNDTMGHRTGDRVLAGVGELIREGTRAYDVAGRMGGEEFGILLPNTDRADARKLAERLREEINEAEFRSVTDNEIFGVSASFGVAIFDEESGLSPDEFYHNADRALYQAKERGRDTVVVFDELQRLFVA
jgi:diguanylate cyclase (GGDEF)-like protein